MAKTRNFFAQVVHIGKSNQQKRRNISYQPGEHDHYSSTSTVSK